MPATIIRSACAGWRGTRRRRSGRGRSGDAPTAIISIAQHASPNVIGHSEFFRAQLIAKSRLVTIRPSSKRFSIQDMGHRLSRASGTARLWHPGPPASSLMPLSATRRGARLAPMIHPTATASRLLLLAAVTVGLSLWVPGAALRADEVFKENRGLRDQNRRLERPLQSGADARRIAAEAAGGKVVLFDGKDLNGWKTQSPEAQSHWKVASEVSLDPADPQKLKGSGEGQGGGSGGGVMVLEQPVHGADIVSERQVRRLRGPRRGDGRQGGQLRHLPHGPVRSAGLRQLRQAQGEARPGGHGRHLQHQGPQRKRLQGPRRVADLRHHLPRRRSTPAARRPKTRSSSRSS